MTLKEKGQIDWSHVASLGGVDIARAQEYASSFGLAFQDPATGEWETADFYLSGNLREKLRLAEAAAKMHPEFRANVEVLRKIQPRELKQEDITVALGVAWIPEQYVEQFARNVLGLEVRAEYVPNLAKWILTENKKRGESRASRRWGTKYVRTTDLLDQALNNREPSVTRRGRPDLDETLEARDKQDQIKQAWEEWLWADKKRAKTLVDLYNNNFNVMVRPQFDGSYLTDLPGMQPGKTLRKHQLDGLARGLRSKHNHFYVHRTGAGKTRILVALANELRRLKIRKKIIQVVPNNRLTQHQDDYLELFPNANLLVVSSSDLSKDRYNATMAKIAEGDWDCVIMSHSAAERIPLSNETEYELTRQKLVEFDETLRKLPARATRKRKELEKARDKIFKQLEKITLQPEEEPSSFTWESLKCDHIMIDEVHRYKNLPYSTRRQGVLGLNPQGSAVAFNMFMKVRVVQQHCQNCGRFSGTATICPACGSKVEKPKLGNTTFASATPLSNTIAELYTWQKFLQPDLLREMGIDSFDAWAAQFAKPSTIIELSPVGTGYREATRFASFDNASDLSVAFSQVVDVRLDPVELKLPIPKRRGGAPITVVSPLSEQQKAYLKECEERVARVKAREVPISEDNYLKIMNDMTKAALDYRLVDPSAPDDPNSKINQAISKVTDIYKRTTNVSLPGVPDKQNLAQVIFCDMSVPQKGFNLYDDGKRKLIAAGIPEEEIAFIHDAKDAAAKQKLFDAINEGKIRVLFASTPLAGEGVNMQRLLFAIHHLDALWTSQKLLQRTGRIERQGNLCPEFEEYRYVTEGGDAYRWQAIERKAMMSEQILSGEGLGRTVEDIDGIHADYATTKALASGDPTVQKRVELQIEIQRLQTLENNWLKGREEVQKGVDEVRAELTLLEKEDRTSEQIPVLRQALAQKLEESRAVLAEPFRHTQRLEELKTELRELEAVIAQMNKPSRGRKSGGLGGWLRGLFGR